MINLGVAPGQLVSVQGHEMHVYSQGEGGPALVFLAGSGTPCPTYDYKMLWSRLCGDHRIAVVERPGYGWSEQVKLPRALDTLLEENRAALTGAGIQPPYVLVPHSMAGLEAIYWAQLYPQEVTAIIGLDMAVPPVYSGQTPLSWVNKAMIRSLRVLGVAQRSAKSFVKAHPAVRGGELTEQERREMITVTKGQMYNRTVVLEADYVAGNAQKVGAGELPLEVPVLLFLSDGSSLEKHDWGTAHKAFFADWPDVEIVELDCGHYVHHERSEEIAEAILGYLRDRL